MTMTMIMMMAVAVMVMMMMIAWPQHNATRPVLVRRPLGGSTCTEDEQAPACFAPRSLRTASSLRPEGRRNHDAFMLAIAKDMEEMERTRCRWTNPVPPEGRRAQLAMRIGHPRGAGPRRPHQGPKACGSTPNSRRRCHRRCS